MNDTLLTQFVQRFTALRKRYPILHRNRFLTGEHIEQLDVTDVLWINANGSEMKEEQWSDSGMRCFGMLMDGRAQATGIRQKGRDATLLLVLNAHHEAVEFTLPNCAGGSQWTRLIDTNLPLEEKGTSKSGDLYTVTPRSLLLFVLQATEGPGRLEHL